MAESFIRWRRSDYAKLGRAVSNFNKKILSADKSVEQFLPELKNYKNIKDSIQTRREFNRVVNSLSRINKADALDLVFTKGGEGLTNWELKETRLQARIRLRQLNKEIEEYKTQQERSNLSLMGAERMAEVKKEIEDTLGFELQKGIKFHKIMTSIQRKGTSDWEMKMQVIFKNNYLKALEDYKGEFQYKALIKKIKKLNPEDFYNLIKENNLIDFLSADWYKLDRTKYFSILTNLGLYDYENISGQGYDIQNIE